MATPEQFISNVINPLSDKQAEVLSVVARGNADGSLVDKHQIRSRLSYNPDIQAVTFILRYMVAQKRIEIGDKALRPTPSGRKIKIKTYKATPLGLSFISAT